MASPMIRCLRRTFPAARIDMVVRQDFLELIQHNPHLDRKIGLAPLTGFLGLYQLYRELSRENYDLIYDAHFSLRSIALTFCLRPRFIARFKKDYFKRMLALTFKLPLLDNKRMLVRYIEPLTPFGVSFDGKGPEFFPKPAVRSRKAKMKVGIIPSARWPGKRWPYFRELMKELVNQTDWSLLVLGGPKDHFCRELTQGLPEERVTNQQGELTLPGSAAVLNECDFIISNDTGLMHMADALGIPSILILGPTSAAMGCLPFHPKSRIVEKNLWCRPCSKNGQAPCIRKKRYCLDIPVSTVLGHALVLSKSSL